MRNNKKTTYLYVIYFVGILNLVLFQNCSKQRFEKVVAKPPNESVQNCDALNAATITLNPNANLQINQNIQFSVDASLFDEISWEFYQDNSLISALSTTSASPIAQFQSYANYRVNATLVKQLEDSEENCVKTISKQFAITEIILPPPPAGCLETSTTIQNGTAALPWRINSCECFQAIETNPKNSQKTDHFLITENLNCQAVSAQDNGQGFVSIKYFKGHLDGNNKNILNLESKRTNASVFYGDFNGSIKNIKFENLRLVSLAENSDAAFHLTNRRGVYSHDPITAENINLQNIYVEAAVHASGFAEQIIGNITNVKVSGTIKGEVASGITREVYSLRTYFPSEQFSVVDNAEFNGTLSGNFVAGIAKVNLGVIKNSKAHIDVSETKENLQFNVAGIALTSCAGARVENSESTGTVNLNYTINENSLKSFIFYYGGLVSSNTRCSSNNGFDSIPGTVVDSRSSIVANVNISITRPANPARGNDSAHVNNLIGYDIGVNTNNSYTGQLTYTHPGL